MSVAQGQFSSSSTEQGKPTDVRIVGAELYLLPVDTRMPLRFGSETMISVTCARVRLTVADRRGRTAEGWGETPLNVQWTWPGPLSYAERYEAMVLLCKQFVRAWPQWEMWGHPLELGDAIGRHLLRDLWEEFNKERPPAMQLPYLAALLCSSPLDIALHDAYGQFHGVPSYQTYGPQFMNCDLSHFLQSDDRVDFRGKYPADYLSAKAAQQLPVWHLVGGLDPLEPSDLAGDALDDGYPLLLTDWIERDGLRRLKVKLRGEDPDEDYQRLVRVGRIAQDQGVEWLSVDFNCMVRETSFVNDFLDRLAMEEPSLFDLIRFVEQPFPYELVQNGIDVHSVARRKPVYMDESADNWRHVAIGASLGWTGVALKTCKSQTGVLLTLCWARAHGMPLIVQDLTNPMLAQISHVLLAAHANSQMGVESNSMQFYPDASSFEARVHPGIYSRRDGVLDLSSIDGPGFGYRVEEIARPLPPRVLQCSDADTRSQLIPRPSFLAEKIKSRTS